MSADKAPPPDGVRKAEYKHTAGCVLRKEANWRIKTSHTSLLVYKIIAEGNARNEWNGLPTEGGQKWVGKAVTFF